MAPYYARDGIRLDIVYLKDKAGLKAELEAAGARMFALPSGRRNAVSALTELLRSSRPDLVHTTLADANTIGRAAGTLARVPVVTSLVNVSYGPEYLKDPGLHAWKVRALHAADAATTWRVRRFHALTEHVADVMARRLLVPRKRIDVVPRGRDPLALGERTPQRRSAARSALGIGHDVPLVLSAARHERQKGLDVLVEAFARVRAGVPDAQLVMAGREGNQTPALQQAIARLGLEHSVHILGRRGDVPELMCAADCFVVPSRWEGLGSVLVEAMALQVPIVASDVPPIRETTAGEECARLVQPENPGALADALASTLTDPNCSSEQVKRARARFEQHYTMDQVWEGMRAFYARALTPPRADVRG
jgi:glycosyltransferase involved in cell wall biosynthesis